MSMNSERSLIISYLMMRRLIGGLGILLPLIVVIGGIALGQTSPQMSISAYYYTSMRDCFVGILSGIAFFLLSYRGYERIDDVVSTLAGTFALGLILFPTSTFSGQPVRTGVFLFAEDVSQIFHVAFGGLFFLSLSFMSIFLFTRHTPGILGKEKRRRNTIYRWCGAVMILAVACIPFYTLFLREAILDSACPILILETAASLAFGVSWMVKGNTLFKDNRKAPISLEAVYY